MTCIKCPQSPHARADVGRHEFTYSLLPHAGTFQEAGVVRAAAELNVPPLVRETPPTAGALPAEFAFVRCETEAVVIDTLKPAEDGNGLIVRLYESFGSHAPATLAFAEPLQAVEVVDLLERPLADASPLEVQGDAVQVSLRPFQVLTLRVLVGGAA